MTAKRQNSIANRIHTSFRHPFAVIPRMAVWTIVIATIFMSSNVSAQSTRDQEKAIRYSVDLTDAKNHYLTITATIPAEGDTTELMMAVWTPGSYLVREYARHIDSMEVTANGKKLDFEKTRKNRWTVQTKKIKSFDLKYRLYCNEMSVRTNWVGNEYAMINGAPTFVTVPKRLDRPHIVELKLPRNWTRSATSLRSSGETSHTFKAEDFDELVDSPIVAGNVSVYPFSVGGVEHQLVNIGESGYWDGTKAATDLKRVVQAHQEMWGTVPYDRYLFLNMIVESGGGLEHNNSTVLMTSRWTFRDKNRYKSWLGLASHEFFHTWNVRRLRPKSLVKYDYENEVYTDGLWIAEGITSYYEALALERAGLISRSEFLSKLSRNVEGVQRTGGRKLQSLKDSSYDAWIKFYRPDENSSNTRISYYSKGAVAAFLLDAKIRKLTKGRKSLDDVMRIMFKKYSKSGFTSQDFRSTASKIAGQDLTPWFASAIDSTDELDYSDVEAIGIEIPNESKKSENGSSSESDDSEASESTDEKSLSRKKRNRKRKEADEEDIKKGERDPGRAADSKKTQSSGKPKIKISLGKPVDDDQPPAKSDSKSSGKPWLGFSTSSSEGRVKVTGVKPDSPASDIGLNNDDEVIAINGFRVTSSVDSRLSQYDVGDEIELLIARRGRLLTLTPTIGERQSENWKLRFISKPSKAQAKQLDLWLGTDSEREKDQSE